METIQIVLDKKLLQATDRAARQTKRNRSALVRDALREHLRRLEVRAREEHDRRGYSRRPQATNESLVWEAEAAWPPEEVFPQTVRQLRPLPWVGHELRIRPLLPDHVSA